MKTNKSFSHSDISFLSLSQLKVKLIFFKIAHRVTRPLSLIIFFSSEKVKVCARAFLSLLLIVVVVVEVFRTERKAEIDRERDR